MYDTPLHVALRALTPRPSLAAFGLCYGFAEL